MADCLDLGGRAAYVEQETKMETIEAWVSVDDVAKHLGVAKDSVYRWIDHRGLPAHKIGRLWKFKLSDIDAWVRAGGTTIGGSDAASPHVTVG